MARPKRLNDASVKIVEENILKETPDGFPDERTVVVAKEIPKMERVMFINGRDPGYPLDFHYHSKTHHLKHYTLYHGKEVTLPVEIIDHLENCCESQYGYRPGPEGHPEMYYKPPKYLYQCKRIRQAA